MSNPFDLDAFSLLSQRDPFNQEHSADIREIMQRLVYEASMPEMESKADVSRRNEVNEKPEMNVDQVEPALTVNPRDEALDAVCKQITLDFQQQFSSKVSERRIQQFLSKIKADTLLCTEKACDLFAVSEFFFFNREKSNFD